MSDAELALDISGLHVEYRTRDGYSTALEGASLSVARGEVVALVGESGSGKTTLGMAALGLLAGNAEARYESLTLGGVSVDGWWDPVWQQVRGDTVALIPQDPGVSLNPVRRVGSQMIENLVAHGLATRSQALARAKESLAQVGIDRPEVRLRQYPHELSGGQQQRVLIAMAFSSNPKLIVADEPTSGLDVTVQRVVLDQLDRLRVEHGTAVLFITHDLAVAAERADRIIVLQGGRIVEEGAVGELLAAPQHQYTRTLLAAAPSFAAGRFTPTRPAVDPPAASPGGPLLAIDGAVKTFNKHTRDRVNAVDGVSIQVPRGTTVGIVGESGSGKSTLARLIVSLETPDSGDFRLAGDPIPRRGFRSLRELHRRVQLVYVTRVRGDITRRKHEKLLHNVTNAIHVLEGDPEERERLTDELVEETRRVLTAAGFDLDIPADVDLGSAIGGGRPPAEPTADRPPFRGSTWQNFAKGTPSEIDYLNGEIVLLSRRTGEPAPLNEAIQRILGRSSVTGEGPGTHHISEVLSLTPAGRN